MFWARLYSLSCVYARPYLVLDCIWNRIHCHRASGQLVPETRDEKSVASLFRLPTRFLMSGHRLYFTISIPSVLFSPSRSACRLAGPSVVAALSEAGPTLASRAAGAARVSGADPPRVAWRMGLTARRLCGKTTGLRPQNDSRRSRCRMRLTRRLVSGALRAGGQKGRQRSGGWSICTR